MTVIVCHEERGGEETALAVKEIEKNYKNNFLEFISIPHPAGLAG